MMRKKMFLALLLLAWALPAQAHFGQVLPHQVYVERPGQVAVEFCFWHPFEGVYMNLVKPKAAGLFGGGQSMDLLPLLKEKPQGKFSTWTATVPVKKPGDYYIYMEPQPYWEPAEDCFIVHYTKAPLNVMDSGEGWDQPVGLKMEIVPLTRPYGLYAGNCFSGQALYKGKPLAGAEVEIEFYNQKGQRKAPTPSHITQVVKAGPDGIFTATMPWAGWWGFAALHTDEAKMDKDGKAKPVEVGGVIWVYAHPSAGK